MRIVITGASGNVGTALLHRLVETDHGHELVGVIWRPPKPVGVYQDVRWHELELAEPRAADGLRAVFEGADVVVHLAWGFQPTRNTEYLQRQGVGGSTAVLEAAHAVGVGHLLHMSSVGTYAAGRYGQRVDESWPTTGILTSPYSRNKSAAEALLDDYEKQHGEAGVPITRMRPGFIVQQAAASGLMRYALPGFVPMLAVPLLPLLPLDRRLCIPLVHADDVADAFISAMDRRAVGAFNLAADPPVRRDDVAKELGARAVHVPSAVLELSLISAGGPDCNRSTVDGLTWLSPFRCWTAHGRNASWTGTPSGPRPQLSPTYFTVSPNKATPTVHRCVAARCSSNYTATSPRDRSPAGICPSKPATPELARCRGVQKYAAMTYCTMQPSRCHG